MAQTLTNLITHIIFSTKQRNPDIDDVIKIELHKYLAGIIKEIKGRPIIINGTADHIHMLVQLPPAISTSEALRVVKTNSSRWIHEKWPERKMFAWQSGYGAFSVSKSILPDVARYIEDQEEHHCKRTFQEEFIAFLKKHDVEYDEKYIWQ